MILYLIELYLILFVFCSEDQQLKEELPEEYYKLDPEHDDQVRNPDFVNELMFGTVSITRVTKCQNCSHVAGNTTDNKKHFETLISN